MVLIFDKHSYICLCKNKRAPDEICNIWGIWGTLIQRYAYSIVGNKQRNKILQSIIY